MASIGVRELRQHASRWLERVRGGEAFDITVQGRPVARLIPWRGRGLATLIEEGRARPASCSLKERLAELGPPPPCDGPSPSAELERLREDER